MCVTNVAAVTQIRSSSQQRCVSLLGRELDAAPAPESKSSEARTHSKLRGQYCLQLLGYRNLGAASWRPNRQSRSKFDAGSSTLSGVGDESMTQLLALRDESGAGSGPEADGDDWGIGGSVTQQGASGQSYFMNSKAVTLRLRLTDGVRHVVAVEDAPMPDVRRAIVEYEKVCSQWQQRKEGKGRGKPMLHCKVLVRGAPLRRGILMLTPFNCKVVVVESMIVDATPPLREYDGECIDIG